MSHTHGAASRGDAGMSSAMTLAITRSDALSRIYALSDEINIGAIFAAARHRHCRF
jgi:hypothetical protein